MNILYLSHRVPYPPQKGEKIRTYHQIRSLVQAGHRVTVMAPVESAQEAAHGIALAEHLGTEVITRPLPNAKVRKLLALFRNRAISLQHFYSPLLQQALNAWSLDYTPDAVVCTGAAMAEYLLQSDALQNAHNQGQTRWLMDFMDLDSDKWTQYASLTRFPMRLVYKREARLVAAQERTIYDAFDASFFISQNEVTLFERRIQDSQKLHVSGNGLDTQAFYPSVDTPNSQHPIFLFAGVMDYKPNEDAVLWFAQALWPTLQQRHPDAEFIIAGMQPSTKIQNLAELKGITVTGYVDDILPYFHRATVFVAPFRLARGVQNKILQAFACGLPVVTTSKGAEGINCQHTQHLLIGDTEAELLQHIQTLINEPQLAKELSEAALSLIQHQYSWESQLEPLVRALPQTAIATKNQPLREATS
ncbi:MAG: TIGR03087 family PEP-CTERM/XrtA system glycosyltransferase [Saccharospirillum sp.]